jgi:hypothetical protein
VQFKIIDFGIAKFSAKLAAAAAGSEAQVGQRRAWLGGRAGSSKSKEETREGG